MSASRVARFAVEGGAIAVIAGIAYVLIAPVHIVDGDNAEFATLGALGGRAHPTGYPAYVLYLRALSWLPGASPAHSAALATVLLATATLFVLHRACVAWGARPIAATIAVAMYAASPVVLRMHTEAEVFAPNALIVSLVLWLAAEKAPLRGIWRAGGLGLVAGIGLGNHVTCVLVAPVGLLGVVRGIRESNLAALGASVGGLIIGLSTYAYLVIADGPVSFGRVDTIGDVLAFFLRRDFGGPGAFAAQGEQVAVVTSWSALIATLGRAWLYAPGLGGVALLIWGAVRGRAGETRWAWAMLAVSLVLAGPMLAARFNVPPTGIGLYVVQRFHLLPMLLLAIPVAVACSEVGERAASRLDKLRSATIGTGLGIAMFATLLLLALPRVRAVHSPAMENGVRNMLNALPERSVVVLGSDDLCFGAEYLQHAVGARTDIGIACWNLTTRDWYRERMMQRGIVVVGEPTPKITRAQAESILASGRPLFIENADDPILKELPAYPYGTVMRLLPVGAAVPDPHAATELNRDLFARFDLDYPRPGRHDDYAAAAHRRYAKTWAMLSAALAAVKDERAAREAYEVAAALQPEQAP